MAKGRDKTGTDSGKRETTNIAVSGLAAELRKADRKSPRKSARLTEQKTDRKSAKLPDRPPDRAKTPPVKPEAKPRKPQPAFPKKNQPPTAAAFAARLPLSLGKRFDLVRG